MQDCRVAMVLAGGAALGSYQGGAYERMRSVLGYRLDWLAGSSIGAVNAALIAGNEPERRVERLAGFWQAAATGGAAMAAAPAPVGGPAAKWLGVAQARLAGTGLFRARSPVELLLGAGLGLYDLAPLAGKLERFVDFERLNGGDLRLTVVATDLETGEAVVFDTRAGDRIEPRHILASSGFLPDFQPVEIDGRLLGDGAFVENAPVGVLLGERDEAPRICFVLDLLSRAGRRPTNLAKAAERRLDLLLAGQTHRALDALGREARLRRLLSEALKRLPADDAPELAATRAEARRAGATVLHLGYRSDDEAAGPEKQFDFSRSSLVERWTAGADDMQRALDLLATLPPAADDFAVHRIG